MKPHKTREKAIFQREVEMVELLCQLAKVRPLSGAEQSRLETLVRRTTPKREVWRWSAKEDRILLSLIKRRAVRGRPAPFERNDEIRKIADRFGRTYFAVHRRIERLRKLHRQAN